MKEIKFTRDPVKIKLLRDIAEHLKSVGKMDFMVGPDDATAGVPGCMACEAVRANLVDVKTGCLICTSIGFKRYFECEIETARDFFSRHGKFWPNNGPEWSTLITETLNKIEASRETPEPVKKLIKDSIRKGTEQFIFEAVDL